MTIGPSDFDMYSAPEPLGYDLPDQDWSGLGWMDMGYLDEVDRYQRADGYTEEQVALHCGCSLMDGHPDEECRLHGRFPWSGDWIGAKRVIISDLAPLNAIIATDTEIFVTQESWDTIYRWMAIKVDAARAVRRIVERELRTELAWLRKAGHDV